MRSNSAIFRFYAELNDFLPWSKRQKPFEYSFSGKPSVKDVIEALGVPHTEIDLILVNSRPVGMGYNLHNGDRVSVYPVFESIDIFPVKEKNNKPLRKLRFVADVHLGKLSRYLRLLGFDTVYENTLEDEEIITIAEKQDRVILTRDRNLLKNGRVKKGYCIRNSDPKEQVKEILKRFDLYLSIRPFTRCARCNGTIKKVRKEEIIGKLEPKTRLYYSEFYQCAFCGQVYWRGSHYNRIKLWLDSLKMLGK